MKWKHLGISLLFYILISPLNITPETLVLKYKGLGVDITPTIYLNKDYYSVFELPKKYFKYNLQDKSKYDVIKTDRYLFIRPLTAGLTSTLSFILNQKIFIVKIIESINEDLFNEKIVINVVRK